MMISSQAQRDNHKVVFLGEGELLHLSPGNTRRDRKCHRISLEGSNLLSRDRSQERRKTALVRVVHESCVWSGILDLDSLRKGLFSGEFGSGNFGMRFGTWLPILL